MLRIALVVLGLFCLIGSKGSTDLTECEDSCSTELDYCELYSADCRNFLEYIQVWNYTSIFNDSTEFTEFAILYCDGYFTVNGTAALCDNATYALIDCVIGSSCWSDCSSYATVSADYIILSKSDYICNEDWEDDFENLLNSSSVDVEIDYAICVNGSFYYNSTNFVEATSWAYVKTTFDFYSQTPYDNFLLLEFSNISLSIPAEVGLICVNTTYCCPSATTCSSLEDYCVSLNFTSIINNGGGGGGSGSGTSKPTWEPTSSPTSAPSPAPTTFLHRFSPAASNKPLLINFLLLGVIIFGWIW